MKSKLLKSLIFENKQRCGVALLLLVCLALFLTPSAAQLSKQRRVTALQLGEAAGGSRVTIVSDTAVNDYEAFRRGDRFYVKIPLADLAAAMPHLRADGFEDVQVQKSGDGVIVSFKLQPGASARVDQRGNRLDVIFSSPGRNSYNAANSGTGRTSANTGNPQTAVDRGPDAAGPLPPASVANSRVRGVTERPGDADGGRTPQDPQTLSAQNNANRNSQKSATNPSAATAVSSPAVSSPSPVSSPAAALNAGTSPSYSPLPLASPAVSPASRPVSVGGASANWRQRASAIRQWVAANRLATLLGLLILVSLILYLVLAFRNRNKDDDKAKRAKAPKVQPKYSPDSELKELPVNDKTPPVNARTSRPLRNEPVIAPARSEGISSAAAVPEQPNSHGPQPAIVPATAAATAPSHQWILTKPTLASPTASHDELTSEEEEREVFEL